MGRDRPFDLGHGAIVTEQSAIDRLCRELTESRRFAFDAEFIGEDAYHSQVCLIQVATASHVWLIDPLADVDVTPFWRLVSDPAIEIVVHAGLEDLAISYQHTGQVPRNVFDVQIAAGLVTSDYPISLQRLARSLLGVRLRKSQTLTDWRKRPLTDRQIQYAIEDVGYMLPIHDALRRRLQATGRIAWAKEEFARFGQEETYRQDEQTALSKVRGTGTLDARGLAIARELVGAREGLAKRYNRPPRIMLKDHLLVEIAKHGWTRSQDLAALRGFTLKGSAQRDIADAVARGLNLPLDQCPKPAEPDHDNPDEVALCKFVDAVLFDYCRINQIAYKLVATNRDVRAVVLAHTRGAGAVPPRALQRGWRKEAVGHVVELILEGTRSVSVKSDTNGFRLELG